MSIAALGSSALSSLFDSSLDSQIVSSAASLTASDLTTAAFSLSPSTASNYATDLAGLFKDLAAKDTAAAQKDISQLEKDLGVGGTSSSAITDSPLQKLLTIALQLSCLGRFDRRLAGAGYLCRPRRSLDRKRGQHQRLITRMRIDSRSIIGRHPNAQEPP